MFFSKCSSCSRLFWNVFSECSRMLYLYLGVVVEALRPRGNQDGDGPRSGSLHPLDVAVQYSTVCTTYNVYSTVCTTYSVYSTVCTTYNVYSVYRPGRQVGGEVVTLWQHVVQGRGNPLAQDSCNDVNIYKMTTRWRQDDDTLKCHWGGSDISDTSLWLSVLLLL